MEAEHRNDWLRLSSAGTLQRPGRVARWIGGLVGRTAEARPFDSRTDAYFFRERERASDAWDYYERFTPSRGSAPLRVLDLACGSGGRTSAYVSRSGATFVCVDMDFPVLRATAVRAAQGTSVPLRFTQADGLRLPFRANTFDVCLCENAMEHFVRPDAIIAELARVLRPGGRLFTMFPPWRGPFSGHLRYFTRVPWVHLLPSRALIDLLLAIQSARDAGSGGVRWPDAAVAMLGNVSEHLNAWSVRDLLRAFRRERSLRFVAGYALGEWRAGRLLRFLPWCGELFSNLVYVVYEKSEPAPQNDGASARSYNGLVWEMVQDYWRRRRATLTSASRR